MLARTEFRSEKGHSISESVIDSYGNVIFGLNRHNVPPNAHTLEILNSSLDPVCSVPLLSLELLGIAIFKNCSIAMAGRNWTNNGVKYEIHTYEIGQPITPAATTTEKVNPTSETPMGQLYTCLLYTS